MNIRRLLATGLVAGALAVSAARAQAPASAAPAQPRDFPEKSWNVPNGGLGWDKLKGKVVLIDFWNFKWKACIKGMPGLGELQNKYGKDVQVIGWHVGKGDAKDVEAAVKANSLKFPIVMSPGFDELKAWGLPKIPRAVLIDRAGKIVGHDMIPHDAKKKAEELAKAKG